MRTLPHTAPTLGLTPGHTGPAVHEPVRATRSSGSVSGARPFLLVFPLVGPLPSTRSADLPSLFAGFIGTMGPSDFPRPYMPVLRLAFTGRSVRFLGRTAVGSLGSRPGSVHARAGDSVDDASAYNAVARKLFLSKLNSPVYASPVNASPACYQVSTHDSGPRWVASPSSCGSFTHYSLSVYPDAFRPCHRDKLTLRRSCVSFEPKIGCPLPEIMRLEGTPH